MKLSETVKPISYVKSHASEIVREIAENHNPVVITLNGEAKAILQDIKEYEKIQDSLALLKILAQSRKSMDAGKYRPAKEAFKNLRAREKKI